MSYSVLVCIVSCDQLQIWGRFIIIFVKTIIWKMPKKSKEVAEWEGDEEPQTGKLTVNIIIIILTQQPDGDNEMELIIRNYISLCKRSFVINIDM